MVAVSDPAQEIAHAWWTWIPSAIYKAIRLSGHVVTLCMEVNLR